MQHVEIRTPQNVTIRLEAAGLGERIVAALLDYLLLGCYAILALFVLGLLPTDTSMAQLAAMAVLTLPLFLYFLLCEVFMNGQSVGKRARGIRVVRLDGAAPTLGNYVLRWLLRLVDIGLSYGLVGVISILVTRHGQRLGDLAAGTTVVRVERRAALRDTLFTAVDDDHAVTFYQVEALTRADVETAKEVLNVLVTHPTTPETKRLGRQMQEVLKRKMGVRTEMTAVPFLRTVVADYNHVEGRV